LFERRAGAMAPTQTARELLVVHRRTEAALQACAEAFAAQSGVETGRIAVGVISTAKYFAPKALAAFLKQHPKIDLRLHVGNRESTIAVLEDYTLDFALMGRPPQGGHFEYLAIGDHPHVVIAPPDHRLAKRRRLLLSDLAGDNFLLREEGSGTRAMFQELLEQEKSNPRVGMEIDSNETIKQAVIAGIGVALISAHTVSAEIADGRLIVLPIVGTPIKRQWYIVKRTDRRLSPAADALWRHLAVDGASFLPTWKPAKTASRPRSAGK
jgi:LysR family transcriptional regulator for metE and metH